MATKNKEQIEEKIVAEDSTVVDDGREEIYIEPGAANEDPNLFVSVNGVNYILPRGETSRVPKAVAYEIRRSRKAYKKQSRNSEKLQSKAE